MSIQDRIEKVAVGQITVTDFLIFYAEQTSSIQQSIIDEIESFIKVLKDNNASDHFNFNHSTENTEKAIVSAHSDISNKHIGKYIYFTIEEIEKNSDEYYHLCNRGQILDNESEEFDRLIAQGNIELERINRIVDTMPYISKYIVHYLKYDFKLKEIEDPTELTNRLLTKLKDYKPKQEPQPASKKPMLYHRLMTKLEDYKPEKTTQSTSEESDNASNHKPEETSQDNTFENDYVNYDEVFKKHRISVVEPFKKYIENHKPIDFREASFVFVQLSKRLDVIREDVKQTEFAKWMVDNQFMKEWIYRDEVLKNKGFDASKKTRNKEEYKAETRSRLDNFYEYFDEPTLKLSKNAIKNLRKVNKDRY